VLLRARAIETGAFILAPAQTGLHPNGRRTWGHSLIIDPWGRVLADAGDKPGVAVAVIELNRVREVRQVLPQLEHDKPFSPPASPTSNN
jgi:predicted amidohydrolase